MSRILVVFHSRTGTARKIALGLANAHDWAIGEIRPHRPAQPFASCLAQALLRLRPAIDYQGPDPAAFDLVVLVSPVWCGTLSGPMRSFLHHYGTRIRAHAVFMVMGGSGAPAASQAIDRILRRPARANAAQREAVVAGDGHRPALVEFARPLLAEEGTDESTAVRRVA